jgi:hypothetical protein
MKPMHALAGAALLLLAALTYASSPLVAARAQATRTPFAGVLDEHPAIRYADAPTTDRVGRLAAAVAAGQTLGYDERGGYLHSVLQALGISPESQLLIFSKTGVQRANTGPRNPRALYFDDSVVVGYIAGARYLEIASHDPQQGVIFYTVDQLTTSGAGIVRRTNCLACHVSSSTMEVPGLIARSNFTDAEGNVLSQLGFHVVDHRTPLSQRWGGWFVTGKYDLAPYGGVTHLGNIATALHPVTEDAAGASNEILFHWMETNAADLGYPSHDSDIAALLVFDHQAKAINLLTRLNWETRVATHDGVADFSRGDVRDLVNEISAYFLFVDEAPPPARLTPRPGFAARFAAASPRDSRGRSLRELDLDARLLKYSCSYMIYSPAFDALPAAAREAIYRQMAGMLADGARLPHLSKSDRSAVREILRATKADWPKGL